MKASAIKARPRALSATCSTNQVLRAPTVSAPGASPLSSASPTRPVASGAAKNDTAEPRSRRSLASCNRTRQRASIDSAGPRPTSVSCETATTWTAAPAQGIAIVRTRGAGRKPMNGANVSAVANPYSARATRCSVTITPDTGRAHDIGPGRLSGRHLLDQPYRHTPFERRIHDLEQQTRGGLLTRVDDHEDRADFLRCRPRIPLCRLEYLEDVAQADAIAAALVDEVVLLGAGDRMRIALGKELAGHPLLDGRRTDLAGVAERLERHRQLALMNALELRDDLREHLLCLDRRDAGDADRDDHVAPPAELEPSIDARQQQRIADVERCVARGPDGDLLERGRGRPFRQPVNRGRRSRAEHAAPRQPLLLAQEPGGVELPRTERTVGLMRVGAQHILHDLPIRAAPVEYRLAAFRDRRRRRLHDKRRGVRWNRIDHRRVERNHGGHGVARSRANGVRGSRCRIRARHHGVATLRDGHHLREIQNLTGIDPVRVFDDGGIETVNLRP